MSRLFWTLAILCVFTQASTTLSAGAANNIKNWSSAAQAQHSGLNPSVMAIFNKSMQPLNNVAPYQIRQPIPSAGNHGSGDYLGEMLNSGGSRWSADQMPLRVYIADGGGYGAMASACMDEWARVSQGRLSWVRASAPEEANITVQFAPSSSSGVPEHGQTATSYKPDGTLATARVTVFASQNGYQTSMPELKKTCLHEIGHALGLTHSNTAGDIMYWQSNNAQAAALGQRDAGTIKRLYAD